MALHRTALRLATIESLRPAALAGTTGAAWPTLAEGRVFDTRIDPWIDANGEMRSCIAVYTENDLGYGSQKAGGPPYKHEIDLVFELSQITFAEAAGDPQTFVAGIPVTDEELEATLDLLEYQIEDALLNRSFGVMISLGRFDKTTLWRWLTGSRVKEPRSMTHRTSEEAERLARRTVTWKVEIDDPDGPSHYPRAGATGLDRLPQPLRDVAIAFADEPAYAPLISGLADGMVPRAKLPQLKGINLNVEALRPGQSRTGTPNLSAAIAFPTWTWRS